MKALSSLGRKTAGLLEDPVLRMWALRRLAGLEPPPPPFRPHRPPYLDNSEISTTCTPANSPFSTLDVPPLSGSVSLVLPGRARVVDEQVGAELFDGGEADIEIDLAIQRFAWLPLQFDDIAPAWVERLWRAWCDRFARQDGSWAWHPYTAAERAINILNYARRHGLPRPASLSAEILREHGHAIAARLEYFGEHDTSNHLANNGRGLFIIGLALQLEPFATMGEQILLAEAERLFPHRGMLREGSSHYHLLLVRNYAESWLWARAYARASACELEDVVGQTLRAVAVLNLPARLPLIGDISPDCPPAHLSGLLPNGPISGGWLSTLGDADRSTFLRLRDKVGSLPMVDLAEDGWCRQDGSGWSALWYVAPEGLPPMPGHAHQDCTSFELHNSSEAVIVDAGRGSYRLKDSVLAKAHNVLLLDGHAPFPLGKPYYSNDFKLRVSGGKPVVRRETDSLTIEHRGFAALGGVGTAERNLTISGNEIRLRDRIEGNSAYTLARHLLTPLVPAARGDTWIELQGANERYRVRWNDGTAAIEPATIWRAYNDPQPANQIRIVTTSRRLPWNDDIWITRIAREAQ